MKNELMPHGFEIPTESQKQQGYFLFKNETKRIIFSCMEVHNELGNGFLEPVYQEVTALSKAHKSQVLIYLNAANKKIGLLINFGTTSLKWERISNLKPTDFA